MGTKLHRFTGDKTLQSTTIVTGLASGDMIFIDEAHALSVNAQESLYDHLDAKMANIAHPDAPVPECCFIVATDQPSKMRKAFRKRLVVDLHLQPYEEDEMIDIVPAMCGSESLTMTPQARRQLSRVAQGVPRKARHHIQSLACHGTIPLTNNVNQSDLMAYLAEVGIDEHYRTRLQQHYMSKLRGSNQGVASLAMLASIMSCESEMIEREIEPYLFQQGWADITRRGRRLTDKGRESLVVSPVAESQPESAVTP